MNRWEVKLAIRRAVAADAAMLAALGARTFIETFAADNSPEDIATYVAHAYGVEQQLAELQSASAVYLVGEVGGIPAAYAFLRPAPLPASVHGVAEQFRGSAIELVRFYVDAPFHGQGLAPKMMHAVVEEGRRNGASVLWLGVWERNARARRFYEKSGFHDIGGQQFKLGTDVQLDRVMARVLGP